jgi:glutamyl-tRNA reductase
MQLPEVKTIEHIISRFCIVGINYKNATAAERGLFAIAPENRNHLLAEAKQKGFRSLFALSTCNRAELYAFCQTDSELTELFLAHTNGTAAIFSQHGFIKRGNEAITYFFKVAAGLQSQITGDYEIVGQLKCAVAQSRKEDLIGPVMDRTINYVLQASKAIKTNTQLSNGTVSVSYAAVEWLKQIGVVSKKTVLIVGAGALAKNIAKNLQHYLQPASITIINRTEAAAKDLAQQTNTSYRAFTDLEAMVACTDIIIVCTNSPAYVLLPQFISAQKSQYVLDLSVPENVHPGIKNISNIYLAGVDEVSKPMQAAFAKRNADIPKANEIIRKFINDYHAWLEIYKYAPAINDIRSKLYEISTMSCCGTLNKKTTESKVKKTVGALAINLRSKNEKGCQYITAINDFLNNSNGQ